MLKTSASVLSTVAALSLGIATLQTALSPVVDLSLSLPVADAAQSMPAPEPPAPPPGPPDWAPPAWMPRGGDVSPLALGGLDGPDTFVDGPRVRARAALVANLDTGEVLWSKRADERFPVASLTKMVSSLTLAAEAADLRGALDADLCVSAEQYPTRSGARSRFETGVCHPGWDWLGAALVASDNRGAMGLPALADTRYEDFIEAMNRVSLELGMTESSWTDPSGIEVHDMSTARDMARAVVALASHPELSTVASAPSWTIQRKQGPQTLHTTNRLIRRFETLAAKTGYTDPARYCFATVVRVDDTRLVSVVLGAPTSSARFSDTTKLLRWAVSR